MQKDTEKTTISTMEALEICRNLGKTITIATLHKWLHNQHDELLFHQPNGKRGRYYIYKLAFLRFIKGEKND